MNRYHRYQNVNSYWYDEVPKHWKKTKNKYVFHQDKKVVGSSWEDHVLLTMGKSGVKPRDMEGGGKFPASFENYQVVTPNQIIFCLFDLDETPRTVGKSSDHGMITSAYDVFSTTSENDPQFWTYFYQMIDDHKGLRPYYTGLRKVVRSETFMGIEVFSPPIEEQKLISRYLDKKTSQIDSLVEKIQKKIELLKEQRSSLINHYVTKGLDPNVEMKDSGVEWIGEIPKHWSLKKITHVINMMGSGTTPKSDNKKYYEDGNINWLVTGDLNDDYIFHTSNKITQKALDELSSLKIYPENSLLIAMYGATIGKLGILKIETTVNQATCVLNFDDLNSVDFWFYVFLGNRNYLVSLGYGGGQPNISQDVIKGLRFPSPPTLDEQLLIVNKIRSILINHDEIIRVENTRIKLLREYRQSLISSVVTGKVRVTEDMV